MREMYCLQNCAKNPNIILHNYINLPVSDYTLLNVYQVPLLTSLRGHNFTISHYRRNASQKIFDLNMQLRTVYNSMTKIIEQQLNRPGYKTLFKYDEPRVYPDGYLDYSYSARYLENADISISNDAWETGRIIINENDVYILNVTWFDEDIFKFQDDYDKFINSFKLSD